MVTIVTKSGEQYPYMTLINADNILVQAVVKRCNMSGNKLLDGVKIGEVNNFKEWREDEWWVCFNVAAVEGVK